MVFCYGSPSRLIQVERETDRVGVGEEEEAGKREIEGRVELKLTARNKFFI